MLVYEKMNKKPIREVVIESKEEEEESDEDME
jgi:hypothetical protein